jgi:hypothetical protein
LKKNSKDAKELEVSLIGQAFQACIDHLFWYLPFFTVKQAHEMLAKKEMSDEPWTIKRDEIKAKRFLERAPADLRIKMESLDCRALVWKGGRWCRCSHDESSQPLESRRRSVIKLELCV